VLTISFSANDHVGHRFGPYSQEVMDMALRIDRQIGTLLDFVDAHVGLRNSLVIFTADHGVAPVPEYQASHKLPGRRIPEADLRKLIDDGLKARYGRPGRPADDYIQTFGVKKDPGVINSNIYLNQEALRRDGIDLSEAERVVGELAMRMPGAKRYFTRAQLENNGMAPADPIARTKGDQFLWGRDLLIAPVYTKGATSRSVYLPAGDWYDWWTNARVTGGRTVERAVDLATMPIYARAGAIVPVDPIRQYADEPASGPTSLHVFPGANGAFTLYDDDGISQEYLAGRGNWIRMSWNDATRTLTLDPGAPAGATDVVRSRSFHVVLPDGTAKDMSYNGRRVSVTF